MKHHPEVVAHVRAEIIRLAYPGIVPTEQQIADLFRDPLEYTPKKTGELPSWYRPGLRVQEQITVGGPWFWAGPVQIEWMAWVNYRPKMPKLQDLPARKESKAYGIGWTAWGGGTCPVPHGTRVDAKNRDGYEYANVPADGRCYFGNWEHLGTESDIIAYRHSKQA